MKSRIIRAVTLTVFAAVLAIASSTNHTEVAEGDFKALELVRASVYAVSTNEGHEENEGIEEEQSETVDEPQEVMDDYAEKVEEVESAHAESDYPVQYMRVTCYTATGNPTASGVMPREGITVAGKREWLGYTAILYRVNEDGSIGEIIGYFVFEDTGYGMSTPNGGTIELGQSIDVYRDTLDGCYSWIAEYGDYLYVQVVPSVG